MSHPTDLTEPQARELALAEADWREYRWLIARARRGGVSSLDWLAAMSKAACIACHLDALAAAETDRAQHVAWQDMAARMRDAAERAECYAVLACAPRPIDS